MSALNRVDGRRTADVPVMAGTVVGGHIRGPGLYLTDEVFLYRVVGVVGGAAEAMVQIEDCYRLDVVSVPVAELRSRRLRAVTPSAIAA